MAKYQITTGFTIIAMLGLIPAFAHAGSCSDDMPNSSRLCVNRPEIRMQD